MIIRAFFFTLFFFLIAQPSFSETLSVKGDNVNLRSGPGVGFDIKWAYGNGFPLRVVERKGEWIKVRDFEKDTGWIHTSLLSGDSFVIVKSHKGTDKKINIRSGPSTRYDIVGKAFYGVVFRKLDSKSGWIKVRHESGLEGWIKETLMWQR
ncbi:MULTISPECIES: SH3 domain-containing protein [Desulfosediminicola]|uniref:SH3 domain-containing protein n=1 Tax=Desulfosediminicola TaxID=2886823 RepID=UPI0010ACF289|nr:SH3 domain-containing protein [Desulfosediminicola ganghwensis]